MLRGLTLALPKGCRTVASWRLDPHQELEVPRQGNHVITEATAHPTRGRGAWGRLALLVAMLSALALVSSSCSPDRATESSAKTSKVTVLRSVSQLQDRFNEDLGKVRLILLLSPT